MGWFFLILLASIAVIALVAWSKRSAGLPIAVIDGPGEFDLEIVGESHYQDALRAVCGPGKVRHKCVAFLLMEDSNPHDSKAVAVIINSRCVGYLNRQNAREYRSKIAQYGKVVGQCGALIVGGGKGRENVGVWLDLPTGDDDEG